MSASGAVDVGFLEVPSAIWSERGFPNFVVVVAPYGAIVGLLRWSSKVPPAPEVLVRGALHRRGFY